ncbi:uncharacterized protein [Physcomitrium patens]|uniref:uncharacterized protein isoform X2 n=1 Tax=Physcomitrium patens TaxID=3218 RepID=UPI003CCCEBE0
MKAPMGDGGWAIGHTGVAMEGRRKKGGVSLLPMKVLSMGWKLILVWSFCWFCSSCSQPFVHPPTDPHAIASSSSLVVCRSFLSE